MRGDMPLQLAPPLIHRVSLRTWLRQPEQHPVELGSEDRTRGGAVARRVVQPQRHPASRIRRAHETEERLEMRVLHGRTPHHDSMPRAAVDGTTHDALRVPPRHRDRGLCAPPSPGTAQDGKEAQHRLLLTEEDGVGWQLPETAASCPFFCARCGAFSS